MQSFNIQFYCRNSKVTKNGTAPLEISVNLNGERKFISLPYKCTPAEFNRKKQPKEILDYMAAMRKRINEILSQMVANSEPLTIKNLTDYIKNGGFKSYTVENLFDDYIKILDNRLGKTITKGVYEKYILVKNLFFQVTPKEAECSTITPANVSSFKALCENRFKPSTTAGYLQKLKTFLTYGFDNGRIKVNPFVNTKISKPAPDISYLTEQELDYIANLQIPNPSLKNVRDFFLFECYSGISYCDIEKLKPEDVKFDNGILYVIGNRKKTGKEFTSVLLPQAKNLLTIENGVVTGLKFRTCSVQKINVYLHEIERIYNIPKKLTTHIGRHTYATLLANKYKCRMEVVASALGDSLKITVKHYAKFLNETTISEIGNKLKNAI